MASSQHRCVFVGNIPYDATEEQLIEICQEVGPVVSFRLVIDRETGKPKGYGFCEYKDEETALSARRNLQGYDINGRQLRVDFAENDKGADRNREQGRGGPGLAANVDSQKQLVASVAHGESVHHQPIGLHIAITAAAVMAGALGGAQAGIQSIPNGLHGQSALANDPLTLHLAKMSRIQLNGIISELKAMATQNKELARQLLIARPQLPKALFQAQIMLGMVTPQVSNIRQTPGLATQPPLHDSQQGQPVALQTLPRALAPAQNKMQPGLMAKVQDSQVAALPQNPVVLNQFSSLPQPQIQLQQHANNHGAQQALVPLQSAVSTLTAVLPQSLGSLSSRSQVQAANSSSSHRPMQPSLLHHSGQVGAANAALFQMANPNATIQPSLLPRPPLSDAGFQPGPSVSSVSSLAIKKDAEIRAPQVPDNGTQVLRSNAYSNAPSGSMFQDSLEPVNRPQKLMKMDDGRRTSFSAGSSNATNTNGPGPSQVSGAGSLPVNPVPKTEGQISQSQLPPDVESVLLQQVLNLTPEQLSLLPPEQQQQVLQLQQVLRRDQVQI